MKIGLPVVSSDDGWAALSEVAVDGDARSCQAPGADSLQALINALIWSAATVNELRALGHVTYEGARADYNCLDELLRTPATGGYLPTGIDRPQGAEEG